MSPASGDTVSEIALPRAPEERERVIREHAASLAELPLSDTYLVVTRRATEGRRTKQNRLARRWAYEIGIARTLSAIEAHGEMKALALLPLRLAWEDTRAAAELEQAIMDHALGSDRYLEIADHAIRSRRLSLGQFAEYLFAVQRLYAAQGIDLQTKPSDDGAIDNDEGGARE